MVTVYVEDCLRTVLRVFILRFIIVILSLSLTDLSYHPTPGAIGGGEYYGDDERNAVLRFITCVGTESRLIDCPFNTSGTDVGSECGPLKDAHVVCQGEIWSTVHITEIAVNYVASLVFISIYEHYGTVCVMDTCTNYHGFSVFLLSSSTYAVLDKRTSTVVYTTL